jgi:hypothetical protein
VWVLQMMTVRISIARSMNAQTERQAEKLPLCGNDDRPDFTGDCVARHDATIAHANIQCGVVLTRHKCSNPTGKKDAAQDLERLAGPNDD